MPYNIYKTYLGSEVMMTFVLMQNVHAHPETYTVAVNYSVYILLDYKQ